MAIQAIETTYRGVRFRSRLEARWAVFFDALEWCVCPECGSIGIQYAGYAGRIPCRCRTQEKVNAEERIQRAHHAAWAARFWNR